MPNSVVEWYFPYFGHYRCGCTQYSSVYILGFSVMFLAERVFLEAHQFSLGDYCTGVLSIADHSH